MELVERKIRPAPGSFFLFGPRGAGKSTWLRHVFPGALWLDLLDPEQARSLSARPERLEELVAACSPPACVVIDEIQRVPDLLRVVHSLIERRRDIRFVMTGSSSRKLKRTGADLLAGRAVLRRMHPFMAAELGNSFDLKAALRQGLLPLVLTAENPADVLRTYVALYLKEEVQAEGLVRNLGAFARFLEAISFSHASALNLSNVARECSVERKTVEGYVGILEDLLLAWRLPVFTHRAGRAPAGHPKLYLADAGVFSVLRPRGPLDSLEEASGAALEGLVAQHLRAWADYCTEAHSLHYWRTRAGSEVDFVIYGETGLWAIEVKHGSQIHPGDLRGLKAFRQDYPECRPALLYLGAERLARDGILCLPVGGFLRELVPERPPWTPLIS